EQDEFALRSHTLAKAAADAGKLKNIIPVFLDGKKPHTIKLVQLLTYPLLGREADNGIRISTMEKWLL
ncbi:hypothetical protein ANCDUO_23925, partial [Ancylostoma duodenale]